jgi:UDP-N-acetylmuramyl pentapeptide phosphotransferase/UDP-N-acetylglucosamine-1-phosphate transferase
VETLTIAWAAAAVLASWAGVAVVRIAAQRWKWLDHPTHRGMHSQPVPRGGGLAIVIVSLAAIFWSGWTFVGFAAIAIAVVSWIDDLRSLPSSIRFLTHSAAAVAFLVTNGSLNELGVAGVALTFLWIAGLTNAYNFMDGIDGIAGLQGVIAGAGFALYGATHGLQTVSLIGAVVCAACVGFLAHNWSPAKIFMGDVGAAYLGFLFAVLAVVSSRGDVRAFVLIALVVWPFVFDTTFTILRRLRKGENILAAHRSHLYQRLVEAGWGHRSVALLYGGLAALGVVSALLTNPFTLALIPLSAVALWILVIKLEQARRQSRL